MNRMYHINANENNARVTQRQRVTEALRADVRCEIAATAEADGAK